MMARSSTSLYDSEFPLLRGLGLYASQIAGDGNCLFNAISDQLYGHPDEHKTIRARVVAYMREHKDHYKRYVDVGSAGGAGVRRNPKRKIAGTTNNGTTTAARPREFTPATQDEIDQTFEHRLKQMQKGGTWGDNMEINAFSAAYSMDVRVYQRDFAYVVSQGGMASSGRVTIHVAYHEWSHYSSIRNLDGPHVGPPQVKQRVLSAEEEREQATASKLLESDAGTSYTSTQDNSSIERDADSDDEAAYAPNKRRNRRLSHAVVVISETDSQSDEAPASVSTCSLDSSLDSSPTVNRRPRRIIMDSDDEREEVMAAAPGAPGASASAIISEKSDTDVGGPERPKKKPVPRLKLTLSEPPPDGYRKKVPRSSTKTSDVPTTSRRSKSRQKQTGPQVKRGSPVRDREEKMEARNELITEETKAPVLSPESKLAIMTRPSAQSPTAPSGMKFLVV